MGFAIKAEFRKLFTTRLWWGMAIAIFVIGALFAAIFAFALTLDAPEGSGQPSSTAETLATTTYTGGLGFSYLLTMVIGILSIGQEYRHQTITSTFLAVPRRMTAMLAKVVSLLGIGALYGVIALVGSVSVGAITLVARDADPFPTGGVFRALALSLLVLGLWALIGLGAGILIKNQVASLLIMVGIGFILEPILGVVLNIFSWGQDIAPYLPGAASAAVTSQVSGGGPSGEAVGQLSWWAGALVLTAYAAVLTGLGMWRTRVRDVS